MGKDLNGKELGKGYTQKKNKAYKKSFRLPDGRQSSVIGRTFRECEMKFLEKMKELDEQKENEKLNGFTPKNTPTITELYDIWIEKIIRESETIGKIKTKRDISGASIYLYKQHYKNHIEPYFRGFKVDKITEEMVNCFIIELAKKNLAARTINSIVGVLKQLLQEANKRGYITETFYNEIPTMIDSDEEKEKKKMKREALKPEHIKLFLECAKSSYYSDFMGMLLFSGMRQGEVRALKWSDIEGDIIHVQRIATVDAENNLTMNEGKTKNAVRDIAITKEIRMVLDSVRSQETMLRGEPEATDYIFKSIRGKVISRNEVRRSFEHTIERCKKEDSSFPKFSPHKLRHNYITEALSQGTDILVLQDIIGHKVGSDITERVYRDRKVRKITEAMENIKVV